MPVSSAISSHLLLFLWALLAVSGIIWCFFIVLRPRTNQTCIFGMLVFFVGWLIECVAHSLVGLWNLSPVFLLWGVSISSVCFVSGFLTAAIGICVHTRNEHRYRHGFTVGVLALALNGWVVVRGAATWAAGRFEDLAGGMVLPLFGKNNPLLMGLTWAKKATTGNTLVLDPSLGAEAAADLAAELIKLLHAQGEGDWREVQLREASLVSAIHPRAQALLFSPQGASWMSLSLHHSPGLATAQLPELSEVAAARVLKDAADHFRRGASRLVVSNFETSRLRYVAILPTLPGPHAFDHWIAAGQNWTVEVILWSPSAGAPRFEEQALAVGTTMLRVASERGFAGIARSLKVETLFQKGVALSSQGDTDGAVQQWMQAAGLAPSDVEIAVALARAHERLKRPDAALQFLDSRRLLLSASPVVTAVRAHFQGRFQPAAALAEYDQLFETGYSDDDALNDYLTLLSESAGAGQVIETLRKYGGRHSASLVLDWRNRIGRDGPPATADLGRPRTSPAGEPSSVEKR